MNCFAHISESWVDMTIMVDWVLIIKQSVDWALIIKQSIVVSCGMTTAFKRVECK